MEQLISAIPLIAAAVVPPLVAMFRAYIAKVVSDHWIPVLLPIGGGVVAALAHLAGVDATLLKDAPIDPTAWQTVITGIVSGFAAIGVHQIKRQVDKAPLQPEGK